MQSLGIDIGSVSAKACLVDSEGKIVKKVYMKNKGIIKATKELLKEFEEFEVNSIGVTGSGRDVLSKLLDTDTNVTEIIAHATGARHLRKDCKTVIDIGGEDSKLILIDEKGIHDFSMNTACGGGTGSMIETIAEKFDIPIEKVGEIALKSKNKINLPSKCGIFCQSAVVSRKNMGLATEDILMGVCRGVVENCMNILVKGKELEEPIIFQGACAKNIALVECFRQKLGKEIIVSEECEYMGALGAAIIANEQETKNEINVKKILEQEYKTVIHNASGCSNNCEIIMLKKKEDTIGCFGNRCEKCISKVSQ